MPDERKMSQEPRKAIATCGAIAVSIVGFALQRDRIFALISTVVLLVLLVSFLLGKVE